MGYKTISIKLPTGYDDKLLRRRIEKIISTREFNYTIENKSLDARNKKNIHWQMKVVVESPSIKKGESIEHRELKIPHTHNSKKATILGTGPAGFFAALVLQKAGFNTTLIERGSEVNQRSNDIDDFEATGNFKSNSNYAYGEGGAGTFSDGKLTSRSKRISLEKDFILRQYVYAGAPNEILYMTHPHLGSDKLKIIVKNLRKEYINLGGQILFNTTATGLNQKNGKITALETNNGVIDSEVFLIAPGHSSYDTYRFLMKSGVQFRTKNFAIGSRMEHHQEIINIAQWGKPSLPGVKAAEYRLTSKGENREQVYSFCMCPGGIVVPAAATKETNIVNGMSRYMRDNKFANAACVANVDLSKILGREISALETLIWMEALEKSFFEFTGGYTAPACSIQDFIKGKLTFKGGETSYPLGIEPAPLWEMLPERVSSAMKDGLRDFTRKIRGFDTGNIMGLESKTSAPIQVIREPDGRCTGFENLYVIGEGSGYAGGIISSAADGVKIAMNIIS